jgi:hypothetical protein
MPEHPRYDEDESALARDLPGALRAASDVFPGPRPDLVGRGHTRGRRLRRNRRIRLAVAGTALAAVAMSGVYVVAGLGDDAKRQTASSPTQSSAASGPTASAPIPTVSAEQMLATLKSLLPQGGTFSDERSRGTEPATVKPVEGAFASLVYRNGAGASSGIDVSIGRSTGTGQCLPRQVRPYDQCTATPLPDGSTLVTTKGFTYPSSDKGQKMWTAELVRPDGIAVEVHAYGGGGEKGSTSTAEPVLTTAQLEEIAKSPAWAPVAASAAGATAPQQPQERGPAGDKVVALLKSFLPQGTTVSDESAGVGHASFVADDGHGESSVGVTVQSNMTKALAPVFTCDQHGAQALSCDLETLSGGAKLMLLKEKSEKGGDAVRWTADLLRPDGSRVVVSSINSYAEAAAPTRSAPVLDLAQLKAIATDARWGAL